jgi:hypothetical protein
MPAANSKARGRTCHISYFGLPNTFSVRRLREADRSYRAYYFQRIATRGPETLSLGDDFATCPSHRSGSFMTSTSKNSFRPATPSREIHGPVAVLVVHPGPILASTGSGTASLDG